MTSTNEKGLASERVQHPTDIDLNDLHCSTICENVLWKPVSCQQCETHFCTSCINKWLLKNPHQCPLRCDSFIQRPCSRFIAKQLAKLQITCIYESNGCNKVIPYEALEKHEMTCDYQIVQCTVCQSDMLQKNLAEHQCQNATSEIVTVTQRSEIIRVREEFQQYQRQTQYEIQQLIQQLRQSQDDQRTMLVARGIIPNDNIIRRVRLQSTVEMESLNRDRVVLDEAAKAGINNQMLCEQCGNIVWKPVSCAKCIGTFCTKCRPQVGFFQSITTFFGAERPRHGRRNCDNFEEATIPNYIATELNQLRIRCAYARNGCPMILFYDQLAYHEENCEFERIPCNICQLPLSNRPRVAQHTTRACFEEMRRNNPAGIQQQFMILLNRAEQAEAENRRLQTLINELTQKVDSLDSKYVKKTDIHTRK